MCTDCGLKTSATAGTIFHRSHTPLSTWFAAVWFVTSQKNGVSARGLQDALGFGSYETAWAWLHKLRRAMVRPERELLSGVVELDQSFLGGRSHGKAGGATEKAPITIAVERLPSGRLGRVRPQLADRPNGVDQVEFAREVIAPGTEIHTDGAIVLTRLTDHGFTISPPRATSPVTSTQSCPDRTWSPRCSNDGQPAPCTTGSAANTCPTTSTSSPPVQPADLPSPRAAVLPAAPAGRRHRPATPSASSSAAPETTGGSHRRLGVNCTQTDIQDGTVFYCDEGSCRVFGWLGRCHTGPRRTVPR